MDNIFLTAGDVSHEIDSLLLTMTELKDSHCGGDTEGETCTICDVGCQP